MRQHSAQIPDRIFLVDRLNLIEESVDRLGEVRDDRTDEGLTDRGLFAAVPMRAPKSTVTSYALIRASGINVMSSVSAVRSHTPSFDSGSTKSIAALAPLAVVRMLSVVSDGDRPGSLGTRPA